jgi:ATP-dependent helicase/nuclease subunit B
VYRTDYLSLFEQIDNQTLVITANMRLKEHLTQLYLEYLWQKNRQFVLLGDTFVSFDGFVDVLYSDAQMLDPHLEKLISDDEACFLLLSYLKEDQAVFMPSLKQAKLVFSAWQLLQSWCLPVPDMQSDISNINVKLFVKWITRYQTELQTHYWIDKSQRIARLLAHPLILQQIIQSFGWHKVVLVGFDSYTPIMNKLFEAVKYPHNIAVSEWSLETAQGAISITEYLDDEAEIEKVAEAVFELSKQHKSAKIGVIVPDLQSQFGRLVRAFDAYFIAADDKANPLLDNAARQYVISGGESLLSQSIVYQLMLWLKFNKVNNFSDIKLMLSSSYLKGYEQYKTQRFRQCIDLKGKLPESIDFAKLVKLDFFYRECDPSLQFVIDEISKLQNNKAKISATGFSCWLKHVIKAVDYLDTCQLTSLEYQALSQFYLLVNKLMQFERLAIQLTVDDWLSQLQHLASTTLFQTLETRVSYVHILGVLEATEIYFDYLFVVRMNNENWPNMSTMNPYLPLALQRAHNMSHSSTERELEFARSVTGRLLKQAKQVYLSYALFNEEKSQMLSPLVAGLAVVKTDHIPLQEVMSDKIILACANNLPKRVGVSNQCHTHTDNSHLAMDGNMVTAIIFNTFEDDSLRPMSEDERQNLAGGVQIFKNIAECPYRATLVHRLKIAADKAHKPMLSALEKGVIIHHVLEQVWRKLQCSENLLQSSDEMLIPWLEREIKSALKLHVALINLIPKLLIDVESRRLLEVILAWLKYEKMREEPFEILSLEKSIQLDIAGISIKLRVDRIDRLASNHTVIIDYKTSKSYRISDLLTTPITEPQLPLYAIYEDADALAVAMVNGAKIGFQSISSIENWISATDPKAYPDKKIAEDMPQSYQALKQHWQQCLTQQMTTFVEGESLVTPSAKSCQYCEFSIVCRLSYF